jgi:tRNA(Ser,Leu) C12 N-acetylase TAN1
MVSEGDEERPPFEWNVVVTARLGHQRRLRRALYRLVRLHRSGFRFVLIGHVDDRAALLEGVAALVERWPQIGRGLARLLTVERIFPIAPERFDEQLAELAPVCAERLVGCTFHVRVIRRGHKGVIHTQQCERAFGAALYTALRERGAQPKVTFADPDVIVVVEVLGESAGIGFVSRAERQSYSFVRIE